MLCMLKQHHNLKLILNFSENKDTYVYQGASAPTSFMRPDPVSPEHGINVIS